MAIVQLSVLKAQLNVTSSDDDGLLEIKLDAAQDHIERLLGFKIDTRFPDETPPALKEAVLQLASHWYEQREAAVFGISGQEVPFGVWQIITEFRDWGFVSSE